MEHQDLIVIGAGPAGISTGIYTAYFDLKVLVFEEKIPGGLATEIPMLESYPGFNERISGSGLIDRMIEQCKKAEIEIHQLEKTIKRLNYNTISVKSAGENELRGRGVSYCAVCDGM